MNSTLFTAMQVENNLTETTNGMTAYKSTLNGVLDLFSKGSSLRSGSVDEIENLVMNAYNEDKQLALRCLFYLRDIRGEGQGERRVFRLGLRKLAEMNIDSFVKSGIINHIPTYGRWDDLFSLFDISPKIDSAIIELLNNQLMVDVAAISKDPQNASVSLLAKWMPSCNTSSASTRALAKKIYKSLHISEKQYRKMLSKLRKHIDILETRLSKKDYTFDYSKVPSNANMKYQQCFRRNDGVRFIKHCQDVAEALRMSDCCCASLPKDNVATLYPYEIVEKLMGARFMDENNRLRYDNMWKQLPNYFGENSKNKNWMTVVDTSGSMLGFKNPTPMSVAISLGIYIAERNTGIFKDKYVTFSTRPSLIEIKSDMDIHDKVNFIFNNSIISDTNIEAVFDLLLNTAVKNNMPKHEMPEGIFIISDMQFNSAVEDGRNPAVYEMIKEKYAKAGYTVPKIIFWNVAQNDNGNLPVTKHDNGAILVGGCKPGLFEMILSGKNPEQFMLDVLNGERYSSLELL